MSGGSNFFGTRKKELINQKIISREIIFSYNKNLDFIKKDWMGNPLIDGEFSNNLEKEKGILGKVIRWKLSSNPQKEEKKRERYKLNVIPSRQIFSMSEDMIVWLGHSSFFIRINGVSILTDPVFHDLPMIRRLAGMPCETNDIRLIDYVLISHGHRDHFDERSLSEIFKNNPHAKALVPLRMGGLLKNINKNIAFQEAGWFQRFSASLPIDIYFLPAVHWHRRGLFDFNKVLWGSFMIRSGNKSIYFAGDTAYAQHFQDIGELCHSVDYCLMPIGAYKPAFLMHKYHMNPLQSARAFSKLNGKIFIPMHYGTYDISDEPLGEPERKIRELNTTGELKGELRIPAIGEIVFI